MRNIVSVLMYLVPFCCFSQITEQFTDGNLTTNPVWTGDIANFKVNSTGQLQLQMVNIEGSSTIVTSINLKDDLTWEFWIGLDFNPSAQNYAKIYLASSSSVNQNNTNGYYLMIGGTDDDISLFRQAATSTARVIKGRYKRFDQVQTNLQVKVTRDIAGKWVLQTKLAGEPQFTTEGEITDIQFPNANYFAISCVYTKTRSDKFYFDNIKINGTPITSTDPDPDPDPDPEVDKLPPVLQSIAVCTDHSVCIVYNEEVNISNASFTIPGFSITPTLNANKKNIELTCNIPFVSNEVFTLEISGVKDLTGNQAKTSTHELIYSQVTSTGKFNDIVISEIMVNPVNSLYLPNVEYVELYNKTDNDINLSGWIFGYGDKYFELSTYLLKSKGYVVLGSITKITELHDTIPKLGVDAFPILANTGKLLTLLLPDYTLIDWIEYSDSWYQSDIKSKGGFSLERIDLQNSYPSSRNWIASTDVKGATPGKGNSVKGDNPDLEKPVIISVSVLDKRNLKIKFSKLMNPVLTNNSSYYQITPAIDVVSAVSVFPLFDEALLSLDQDIPSDEIHKLSLSEIKCISGNSLKTDTVAFGIALPVSPSDIVINELLFNPVAAGADFVELFNRSGKLLDLSDVLITSRKADGVLTTQIPLSTTPELFYPDQYIILTTDKDKILSNHTVPESAKFVLNKQFPSLPDNLGNVILLNKLSEVIDEVNYNDKMHHFSLKKKEGVSLERVNPEEKSDVPSNWCSALEQNSFATPGCQNSNYRENNTTRKKFWLTDSSITPDNDGNNDQLEINYVLDQPGYIANITVYSIQGHVMGRIQENTILAASGTIRWDGISSAKTQIINGMYVLFIECYNKEGNVKRVKLPFMIN